MRRIFSHHVFGGAHSLRDGVAKRSVNPERDWEILIWFFLVLLIGVSLAGIYMYSVYVVGQKGEVAQTSPNVLSSEDVKNAAHIISERHVRSQELENNLAKVVDPSL